MANQSQRRERTQSGNGPHQHLDSIVNLKLCVIFSETKSNRTARKLVINLSGVPYMDSSGIGALVSIFNGVHEVGGVCRFYGATRKGRQILKMVRLDTVLELVEDEQSALSSL